MEIGVIGLGTMGFPIACRLIEKTEYSVWGYDMLEPPRYALSQMGCNIAASPEDLLRCCKVIFFSLPTNQLVGEYLKKAVALCAPGTIVADLSSSVPEYIRGFEKSAKERGISLVDCPVSGGPSGAAEGTLSVMCGGEEAAVEKIRPIIRAFAGAVTYMGALGCGYVAKLANNLIVGVEIVAIAEAIAFAKRSGLDMQCLFEALRAGAAGGPVMELKGKWMVRPDETVTSQLKIHLKDQHNALACGSAVGAIMPLCALATDYMEQLDKQGRGSEEVAAVIDLF